MQSTYGWQRRSQSPSPIRTRNLVITVTSILYISHNRDFLFLFVTFGCRRDSLGVVTFFLICSFLLPLKNTRFPTICFYFLIIILTALYNKESAICMLHPLYGDFRARLAACSNFYTLGCRTHLVFGDINVFSSAKSMHLIFSLRGLFVTSSARGSKSCSHFPSS